MSSYCTVCVYTHKVSNGHDLQQSTILTSEHHEADKILDVPTQIWFWLLHLTMPVAVTVVTAVHTVRDVTPINTSRAAASCIVMMKLPFRQVTLCGVIDA